MKHFCHDALFVSDFSMSDRPFESKLSKWNDYEYYIFSIIVLSLFTSVFCVHLHVYFCVCVCVCVCFVCPGISADCRCNHCCRCHHSLDPHSHNSPARRLPVSAALLPAHIARHQAPGVHKYEGLRSLSLHQSSTLVCFEKRVNREKKKRRKCK